MASRKSISILILIFLPFYGFPGSSQDHKNGETPGNIGFLENKGQIIDQKICLNPGALFLMAGSGLNIQLRKNGFSYDLYARGPGNHSSALRKTNFPDPGKLLDSAAPVAYHRIDFDLINARSDSKIIVSAPRPGFYNYYTIGTPVEGVTRVRSYSQITYKSIYPGIDMEFLSDGEKRFKYNFNIHPGGTLSDIQIRITGPEITLLPDGSLRLKTTTGTLEEIIPESYYTLNGRKTKVIARFHQISPGIFDLTVNQEIPYGAELTIDPTPNRVWGTYYGDADMDTSNDGVVDASGCYYMGGSTYSASNIATSGSQQGTFGGISDGYLAKFTPSGLRTWATYYGGANQDGIAGMAITADAKLIISGNTLSSENIATPGAFQPFYTGLSDAFLAKFDTSGIRLWGTYYGGTLNDTGESCAADSDGNIYLEGVTRSVTGIATPGSHQPLFSAENDIFLVKFTSNGDRVWGTYYGGICADNAGTGTICTTEGNSFVYISGMTCSPTGIASAGAFQTALNGAGTADGFLAKFNTNGIRQWGTYYGGSGDDLINSVSLTTNNRIIISGETESASDIATPGSFQPLFGGGAEDGFIARFLPDGQRQWGTYYGGNDFDKMNTLSTDDAGNMYAGGATKSAAGIATSDAIQTTFAGGSSDCMLVKFDSAGNRIWGTYYGGEQEEWPYVCSYFDSVHIYLSGSTSSLTNIATPGIQQTTYGGGNYDSFLIRFENCSVPEAAGIITGPNDVCLPETGLVYTIPPVNMATGYHWCVPPGVTITAGVNSNSITVDFGVSAISGNISVYATNSCGIGDSIFIPVTVTTGTLVVVSVSASDNNICIGTPVTFTANGSNGGISPSWQWKVNGINSGTDNPVFTYVPASGDQVICVFTSSNTSCILNNPATSIPVAMTVNPLLPVSVTISSSANPVCSGVSVTFTAAPAHGGSNPVFQWKVNGTDAGTGSPVFNFTPVDGDQITCVLNSDVLCPTGNPDTSNSIQMVVNPNLPAGITITASVNPFCPGSSVTF
ncbi:MAG TPA: hypothetical protein VLR52_04140, partial [Bacteroidales bacterium]|nr:hypothetical protein [Bacteroidales bacterium]